MFKQYFPDGVFWFRVGMLEPESLLHRMKILAEKLDPTTSPTSIEHAQEILRRFDNLTRWFATFC